MTHAEDRVDIAPLFTGSLSDANLRLYEACGYVESARIPQGDGTDQVFLRKPLYPVGEPPEPGASG